MRKSIVAGAALLLATGVTAGVGGAGAASAEPQPGIVERGYRELREQAEHEGSAIRIGGADRYITSTLISEQAWDPELTSVVFLATGENFPDALSLSGSFAGVGPILLTRPNDLPLPVAQEISRLRPCVVVVVGQEPSVSQAVMDQAGALADAEQWKCNV